MHPPAHLYSRQVNNLFENNDDGKKNMEGRHFSTIDVTPKKERPADRLAQTNADLAGSKNFADLRIKLGRKQLPDKYGKMPETGSGVKAMQAADDVSIPSDLDENQWAEINAYDFERFQEEQKKLKEDNVKKRHLVKDTLEKQMQERR